MDVKVDNKQTLRLLILKVSVDHSPLCIDGAFVSSITVHLSGKCQQTCFGVRVFYKIRCQEEERGYLIYGTGKSWTFRSQDIKKKNNQLAPVSFNT